MTEQPDSTPESVLPEVSSPVEDTISLLDKITSKTTLANIAATVGFILAVAYGFWTKNNSIIENAGFLGAGYLFGVTSTTTITESNGKLKAK